MKKNGKSKAELIAEEIARAVNAGKPVAVETVDFSDPNRPKTCLEVDFPIMPVNQVAIIEGNAGKPIYQMSKWWARRRSSVFRSMLLAAAMKAPDEPTEAAKLVWNVYYSNHQKKGALAKLKVADIFMGGGTTIVEGARLGMQMFGNDLNPVAWLIVKNEMAQVTREEVEALLIDIEAEVKPQIMPFYACDGPNGEKGIWTRLSTGETMGPEFDPLALSPDERRDFSYKGPEIIYTFWAKHGPCQVTGCGHSTPIISNPVMAVKTLSVKAWDHKCPNCDGRYDIEESEVRMAPDIQFIVAENERPFATLDRIKGVMCPLCGHLDSLPPINAKGKRKKVELSLLIHPTWLVGESRFDPEGKPYGGSVTDTPEDTERWNQARAAKMRLLEVRGKLPGEIIESGVRIKTDEAGGAVPKSGHFACGACGSIQRTVVSMQATGKSSQVAPYAIQGYSSKLDSDGVPYGGRFFMPVTDATPFNAAHREWEMRKDGDLSGYWPQSPIPFGHMTHQRQPLPQHGYLNWSDMFNPRQLLVHSLLLKGIVEVGGDRHCWAVREYVLGAFQQYLRNQNMFSFWNPQRDTPEPLFSNNNYHPKATVIENCVFPQLGRGNWQTCSESILETIEWMNHPWELVSNERVSVVAPLIANLVTGRSEKIFSKDPIFPTIDLACGSATDLPQVVPESQDLVITDPPFGGLLHYSELSDFFYVWLRLVLKDRYPEIFAAEYVPKTLEVVANKARHPEGPDAFYQRLLTASWREAHRILKPGGILAFTFHHSEDDPWVAVLESLFDAGFYLEATYPIRSDETKGDGEFGAKKVEYDIIHVCRKRTEEPSPVSWARMRRQVLEDIRGLKEMLEHHQKENLLEADLQVIRRGKALEYFSRHYGKVFVDDERTISVKDAIVGINLLLDEESGGVKEPPPVVAEPFTRQFLRLFDRRLEIPRDQMQKYLRGTGVAPSEFEERGWCKESKKIYQMISPLEVARSWQRRHRRGMTSDYDQAAFLVGACFDASGINASDTLNNGNFRPHPALGTLLEWLAVHGGSQEIQYASVRAAAIFRTWHSRQQPKEKVEQLVMDFTEDS